MSQSSGCMLDVELFSASYHDHCQEKKT